MVFSRNDVRKSVERVRALHAHTSLCKQRSVMFFRVTLPEVLVPTIE